MGVMLVETLAGTWNRQDPGHLQIKLSPCSADLFVTTCLDDSSDVEGNEAFVDSGVDGSLIIVLLVADKGLLEESKQGESRFEDWGVSDEDR